MTYCRKIKLDYLRKVEYSKDILTKGILNKTKKNKTYE